MRTEDDDDDDDDSKLNSVSRVPCTTAPFSTLLPWLPVVSSRFNDLAYAWIPNDAWTYNRTFQWAGGAAQRVELVMEGVDTAANVTLNGVVVATTNNMFRRYIVDVTSQLRAGVNSISVAIASPLEFAASEFNRFITSAPSSGIPPDCPPPVQNGFCHVNCIRKEPCSFSWDWGIALAPQGIWRNISLVAYNTAVVRDVLVVPTPDGASEYAQLRANGPLVARSPEEGVAWMRQRLGDVGNAWTLAVEVFLSATGPTQGTLSATLNNPGRSTASQAVKVLAAGETAVNISVHASDVEPWWPNGYGAPTLYSLTVTWTAAGSGEVSSQTLSVGFRTVELVQDVVPGGKNFYFRINGVPVFVKGANWVPADALHSRETRPVLEDLMTSALSANYNMLRNWGGGIYQSFDFYDLADRLGLLVWEEFMAACSLYTVEADFLANWALEVKDQVRRLQHHPSIILWSGNNENEAAIAENWYGIGSIPTYEAQYSQLYFDTVLANVSAVDQSRPQLPSSPSNGYENASAPVAADPQSDFFGDKHFYTYNADCWDVTVFPRPRFASEFGFQSGPSFATLAPMGNASLGDFDYLSNFTAHRNHHPDGIEQMQFELSMHYAMPTTADPTQRFADTLFLTQVNQAYCIKTETEHYRRIRYEGNATVGGYTMGTLYWQANDQWSGFSWSSLEYGGRWKVLQYFAKKFYEPMLVSLTLVNGTGAVYFISDTDTVDAAHLVFTAVSWTHGVTGSWTPLAKPFHAEPASAAPIWTGTLASILANTGCSDVNDCALTYSVVEEGTGRVLSSNWMLLASPANVTTFRAPQLRVVSVAPSAAGNGQLTVTVTGVAPALFTWLETVAYPGHFTDNGFLYLGSGAVAVDFVPRAGTNVTAAQLQANLTVKSLYDRYAHA